MAYQNINQYNFNKWYLINRSEIQDFSLASDEKDYKEEVIFSDKLIAEDDGVKLPFSFDLNNPNNSELFILNYNNYNPDNNLVSSNYYNPNNEDITCFTSQTSCDIGLTGIDNGLVNQMTGQTITFTKGIFSDYLKFNRLYFDRRLKLHQVTGYTQSPNIQFSGLQDTMLFNIVSKQDNKVGVYHELYGGFYQGFYKLFGYDYEIFPERVNKGWSVELLIKPRLVDEYVLSSGETTLNTFYPDNKNIFFYFGTRAENKFYHHASGNPTNDSGYTRVTSSLTSLETCACCNSDITISRCIYVYPPWSKNNVHDPHNNYGCSVCNGNVSNISYDTGTTCSCNCEPAPPICGWECQTHECPEILIPISTTTTTTTTKSPCDTNCVEPCDTCSSTGTTSIENTCESDPLFDAMSNAISFKLCGDPKNPGIGVRLIRFTGGCETTGSCSTTGITYTTGYTIDNLCTPGIYGFCESTNPDFLSYEHWIMLDLVWERYEWREKCDLFYFGGLGLITKFEYLDSLANNSVSLIAPPATNGCLPPSQIELVELNQKWLDEKKDRMGRLKIYVNGRLFHTFEDIEEIIPRGLSTDKEKQVGVPFNISWGGGTQGLHNNLTLTGVPESFSNIIYQQDPELFPNNILSGTSLSALTTNIVLEQNFGGTFDGAISQFRMYTEPISADEVKHNFLLLKDKFDLFNYDCPNCCIDNDFVFVYDECDINYQVLPTNILRTYVTYSSGSIVAAYSMIAQYPVDTDVNVSFTNILGVLFGNPIEINVSIDIMSGNSSGYTAVIVGDDFNNLNGTSIFTGVTITTTGTTNYSFTDIFIPTFNFTPTPTPSQTNTQTPTQTPTPTPSQTSSPTPTPTPTPSQTNTQTPTQTPTPTPSQTSSPTPTPTPTCPQVYNVTVTYTGTSNPGPGVGYYDICKKQNIQLNFTPNQSYDNVSINSLNFGSDFVLSNIISCYICPTPDQVLIDPIITDNGEYISVGENEYLQFVDPPDQILINPIITDNGEYISVGENEYLQFVDPEQNIFDAVLTTIGEYISVGFNQFLRFINPPPSPTPSQTPTPTQTSTPNVVYTFSFGYNATNPNCVFNRVVYSNTQILTPGTTLYKDYSLTILADTGYYCENCPNINNNQRYFIQYSTPGVILEVIQCSTPTPTSSETPTPTPTQTLTMTPSSATPTPTNTITPSITPTQGYKNGLSPETAGDNANQIKTNYPSSTDGLYWIKNDNISGGTPFQIYADMTTDGGGWTLLMVNQDNTTWIHLNAILYNEFSPVISGANYSIISYGNYLKGNGTTFQYMMDANERNSYGGIWTAPSSYSFVNTGNTQTGVTLNIKFGTWEYNDSGIEQRMPWYVPEGECPYITTSESANNEWWGSLMTRPGCGFNPSPWIANQIQNPGIIWYWVR